MWFDTERYVDTCKICAIAKACPLKVNTGSISSKIPGEIFAIDFTTLYKCKGSIENVLVVKDIVSTFTHAVGTQYQIASTVVKVLEREWFVRFGIPS